MDQRLDRLPRLLLRPLHGEPAAGEDEHEEDEDGAGEHDPPRVPAPPGFETQVCAGGEAGEEKVVHVGGHCGSGSAMRGRFHAKPARRSSPHGAAEPRSYYRSRIVTTRVTRESKSPDRLPSPHRKVFNISHAKNRCIAPQALPARPPRHRPWGPR